MTPQVSRACSGVSGGLAQLETALTEVVDVGTDHYDNAVVALEGDELVGYCDFLDLMLSN